MSELVSHPGADLADSEAASVGGSLGLLAVLGLVILTVVAVAPFVHREVGAEPGFAVAVVAVVGCLDLMSAVLLVRQFRDVGDRRSLALSAAYVFALVVLAGYAAAFPGIIGTRPPLGGNASTAPWLWVVWHTGFPVLLAASLGPWPERWDDAVPVERRGRLAWFGVGGWGLAGGVVVAAVVLGVRHLPRVIHGDDLSALTRTVGPIMIPVVVLATCVALAGIRRPGAQRWAAVAATAATGDTVLTLFSRPVTASAGTSVAA